MIQFKSIEIFIESKILNYKNQTKFDFDIR